jgi:diguanylate cyclase (GGDEF)-like protein
VAITAALLTALAGAAFGALATLLLGRTKRPRRAGPAAARSPVRQPADGPGSTPPLDPVLEDLRRLLGAERLVLWKVDRRADALVPIAATGTPPRALVAAGDPLSWCAEQGQPLRPDPRPAWAAGDVLAVPIAPADHPRALTVEGGPTDPAMAQPLAGIIGALLDLRDRRVTSLADLDRFQRILGFLRDLPRSAEPGAFPEALARAAAEVAGSDGALVARFADADDPVPLADAGPPGVAPGGVVLARFGEGGGPRPGTVIRGDAGDLAMAARSGATIRRDGDTDAGRLTGAGETWTHHPRCSASTPLLDPEGRCCGVLTLWGHEPIDPHAVELFEALGPLLAVQLDHSLDLARFRERVERDPLTGLADRAALDDRLALETRRFHRFRRPVALLLLDLDHFKHVNDTHGHTAGDEVLRRLADLLWTNTREPDMVARYGGEEMVVVLPDAMLRQAADVAERIRAAIEGTVFEHEGTPLRVTVSVGVSACPECAEDPRDLVSSADAALYDAKRAGRNRVVAAPPAPAGG